MTKNIFRCYTYKDRDGYYAICLDLTLIDKRDTLEEAVAALDENIIGYLETVRSNKWEQELIPRPVPRREWLHFYRLFLLNAILTLLGKRLEGFMTYSRREVIDSSTREMRLTYA
ncbi:MAG TPA: hypothetical protein EYP55_06800 [Anaerolineae bacterium]|nr:hypothetical protein [Anaerolineae bacterium]